MIAWVSSNLQNSKNRNTEIHSFSIIQISPRKIKKNSFPITGEVSGDFGDFSPSDWRKNEINESKICKQEKTQYILHYKVWIFILFLM